MRVVVPPRLARASLPPPVIELDDPTVVDDVSDMSNHAVAAPLPPPLPPPPPAAAVSRRMRAVEPTQVVEPLPAPLRGLEPPVRIHDTESTGGRISGEMSNASPLPSGPASWRRRVVGLGCIAVLIGSVIGLAIGRSAREAAAIAASGDAQPAAVVREAPAAAPRITVEELPSPAPIAEPMPSAELVMSGEPVVAKPARSRHRAPSTTTPRLTDGHRSARSRALTYDPDALFLKRP